MESPYRDLFGTLFNQCCVAFGQDASVFYQSDGFKTPALVHGLFSESTLLVEAGQSTVTNFASTFEFQNDRVALPKAGDRIQVEGELYQVGEVKTDSAGSVRLILQKKKFKNV